jgi:hypothetical protein
MALTVTRQFGPKTFGFYTVTEVACDSSYLAEGESLTAAELGLATADFALCEIIQGDEAKESELFVGVAYYTPATEKLHLINLKTGKEVASTKNMEKVIVRVVAFGKSRAL